jgi:hypothetical protein
MLKDNSNRIEILNYPVENMNSLHYVATHGTIGLGYTSLCTTVHVEFD